MYEPFQQIEHEEILYLPWHVFNSKVVAGFTTKNGGYSKFPYETLNTGLHVNDKPDTVVKNREAVAKSINFPIENWVCAEQIHNHTITKVTKKDIGKGVYSYSTSINGTDGLYTTDAGILLTLCYADCVPIYFRAKNKDIIGVAHAGWKGSVKNIVGKMVQQWIENEEVKRNDIYVAIGPSIGSCCYKVDDRVIKQVDAILHNHDLLPYTFIGNGEYSLDLKQLNQQLLVEAGILVDNIEVSNYCTSCQEGLFYSYRRDNGKTGRMMSFIGMKEV
ncbi:peptidoglycan editing factor PgeF [Cytobacillus sp. Hm23]